MQIKTSTKFQQSVLANKMDKESLAEQRDIMYMKTDELKAFNLDNLISKDSKNKIVHFNKYYYFYRDDVTS